MTASPKQTAVDPSAEKALLRRCRNGDEEAWAQLFEQHYGPAGRFVFQLGAFTEEDVEEIVQEAFLAVIRSLKDFHGESRFQTWLFRIAANKAQDYRARTRAAKRGGGQATISLGNNPEDGQPAFDPPDPRPNPEGMLEKTEDASLLHAALASLGPPCREVIELRYFADLSYEEIASVLKLNPKTVSSRLSRCLDDLEQMATPLFRGKPSDLPSNPMKL